MTKLYFHAASSGLSGLPTTEQSTLTANFNADALSTNRSMDTTIGVSQTSTSIVSSSTAAQNMYFCRFVSPTLNQTSIAANTWTYNFAAGCPGTADNFPTSAFSGGTVYACCYVWRTSTQTKIGTIRDGITAGGCKNAGFNGGETSEFDTFSGSALSSLQTGNDVIIFEVWFQITPSITGNTDSFYFDGTTETNVTGNLVSNSASYISTPETIAFGGGGGGTNMTEISSLTYANKFITKV